MKKAAAIFFTILYTAFLCFAGLDAFALESITSGCKAPDSLCIKHSNNIAAESNTSTCSNKLFAAVHFFHKQTNNVSSSNSKYIQPAKLHLTHNYAADANRFNTVHPYTAAGISSNCPLFIRHRALLL